AAALVTAACTNWRRSSLRCRRSPQHSQETRCRTISSFVIAHLFVQPTSVPRIARERRPRQYPSRAGVAVVDLVYWLAHTARAIHNTSRADKVRSVAAGSIERNSTVLAVRRLSSFTVTASSAVLTTTRSPRRIDAAGDTMRTVPSG